MGDTMRDEDVIINSGDLNTIEDTMAYLSDCVNKVSSSVNSINGQVDQFQEQINDMKNNVSTLEEEVRSFMTEMKQNALVSNAKQSIMISQMEYDKKFGHRDDVRRRVVGLLQSVDINAIKKNTMENIGEETVVNNPDYWLAPALVALCYWYTDNKEMAQIALKKAIDRSDEKTSFLFCLIHLRANRINTAIKWLNRYLSLQDPTNMDCKIILLLDALSSGVFDSEITNILLRKIDDWKLQLNAYKGYELSQISRWENYFKEKDNKDYDKDNYVNDCVTEKDFVNNVIHFSGFHINMMNEFKKKMNDGNYDSANHLDKIDKLLNMLIFDYEDEELILKNEIQKSNNIINSGKNVYGDKLNENYLLSYSRNDLYTHISNICLNDNVFDIGMYTKKMALAFSKKYIIEAYKNVSSLDTKIELIDLSIVIDDWVGYTKNGSNELELKDNLIKHIENKYYNDIYNKPLFTKLMIVSILGGILVSVLLYKYLILIIFILLSVLIYNGMVLYRNYKYRQNKIDEMNKEKEDKLMVLMCVISEIVDYYFVYIDSNKQQNEFINYIDSLDYRDYIKTSLETKKRNLIIGGK